MGGIVYGWFRTAADGGSMRNGAVAEVGDVQGRTITVERTALPSSGAPLVMSRGRMAAVPAAAAALTEVVVELGETNLWVSTEQAGTVRRPIVSDSADAGRFSAAVRVTKTGEWVWASGPDQAGDIVLSDLLSRVDDPVPLLVHGRSVSGAEALAPRVPPLWHRLPMSGPSRLTLVHPVDLSRRGRSTVERHLRQFVPALTSVRWVSRAAAAVAAVAECADLDPTARIRVLHVGGSRGGARV